MNTYQSRQLNAMGDPTRRAILERLLVRPMSVGKLAEEFPVSRPAISQHLRILKEAHLVVETIKGTRHTYALNPKGLDSLRAYFDRFWNQALIQFKNKVEEQ